MAKVTSKLQLTLPKALADRHGISAGDEIQWESAGEVIRIVPTRLLAEHSGKPDIAMRLKLFDQATGRQRARQKNADQPAVESRGWTREELYENGGTG